MFSSQVYLIVSAEFTDDTLQLNKEKYTKLSTSDSDTKQPNEQLMTSVNFW